MTVQIIKSATGQPEYALLPIRVYKALKKQIEAKLKEGQEYVPFELSDYIDNPVALLRIEQQKTQEQLAVAMNVSQAYISKLEKQSKVSAKVMAKVKAALEKI